MIEPRYIVQKMSGSEWARVIDTQTGRQVSKYNILKGNGWNKADRRAETLNRRAQPTHQLPSRLTG